MISSFSAHFSKPLIETQECFADGFGPPLRLVWEEVCGYVNPFGDSRGRIFNCVWVFDLDQDLLLLVQSNSRKSASLKVARQRQLTIDDFTESGDETMPSLWEELYPPESYWKPEIKPHERDQAFLSPILRDFLYTWRHVLRRRMNSLTFLKMAHATLWLCAMDFSFSHRTEFDRHSQGRYYAPVYALPTWRVPSESLVRVGTSWVVLAQDIGEGLDLAHSHTQNKTPLGAATNDDDIYVVLSLRQIVLCKTCENNLVWTKPETLFSEELTPGPAIDMLIWAVNSTSADANISRLNCLSTELQDLILRQAAPSLIAAAKLGCDLGTGSAFLWLEDQRKILRQDRWRYRTDTCSVESRIMFGEVESGLSYKRDRVLTPPAPIPIFSTAQQRYIQPLT